MRREKWDTLTDEVERVRVRFALWRQSRPGRSRIPEELWLAAVELARSHGVHPIARALGLNDQALRRRLQETRTQAIAQPQPESSPQSTHTPRAGARSRDRAAAAAAASADADRTALAGAARRSVSFRQECAN